MATDDDVKQADSDASDAADNAKKIREQAIDGHNQKAEDEKRQAEELE